MLPSSATRAPTHTKGRRNKIPLLEGFFQLLAWYPKLVRSRECLSGQPCFVDDGRTNIGGKNGDGTLFSLSTGLAPFVQLRTASGKVGSQVTILGMRYDDK